MKRYLWIVAVCLTAGTLFATDGTIAASTALRQGGSSDAVAKELKALEGQWKKVTSITDGKPTPNEVLDQLPPVVVKGGSMIAMENGKVVASIALNIDPTKSPKTIDAKETVGRFLGQQSLGIYKLDGDTWQTCWTGFGVKRDRPTAFSSESGSGLILDVYKRVKQ